MPASPFSARKFLIIFSIAWVVLMVDHVLLLYKFDFPLEVAIIDSAITNILLLLMCLLVMNTLRYYVPTALSEYMNVLAMCIVLTLLWILLSKFLLKLTLNDYTDYPQFLRRSMIIRGSIGFLVLGIFTMISIVWFNWHEQQKYEARKSDSENSPKKRSFLNSGSSFNHIFYLIV